MFGSWYSVSWLRAAIKDFRGRCPQRNLGGRVALSNESLLNNVVLSALNAAVLQKERDDQQSIMRVCRELCVHEGVKQPVEELWRRKVQYFQNSLGVCGVSAEEREVRKVKEAFVRRERKKRP